MFGSFLRADRWAMSQGGNRWERVQGTQWLSQQKCGILINIVISDTVLPTITAPTLERLLPHPSRSLGSQFTGRTCGLRELTLIACRHRDHCACVLLCVCPEKGD